MNGSKVLMTVTKQERKENGDIYPSLIDVFNGFSMMEIRGTTVCITGATGAWACFDLKNSLQVERFVYFIKSAEKSGKSDLDIIITPDGHVILGDER